MKKKRYREGAISNITVALYQEAITSRFNIMRLVPAKRVHRMENTEERELLCITNTWNMIIGRKQHPFDLLLVSQTLSSFCEPGDGLDLAKRG